MKAVAWAYSRDASFLEDLFDAHAIAGGMLCVFGPQLDSAWRVSLLDNYGNVKWKVYPNLPTRETTSHVKNNVRRSTIGDHENFMFRNLSKQSGFLLYCTPNEDNEAAIKIVVKKQTSECASRHTHVAISVGRSAVGRSEHKMAAPIPSTSEKDELFRDGRAAESEGFQSPVFFRCSL